MTQPDVAGDVGEDAVPALLEGPDETGPDLRRILVALDAAAVALSWSVVFAASGVYARSPVAGALQVAAVTAVTVWIIASQRLYRARVCAVRAHEMTRLLRVSGLVGLAAIAVGGAAPVPIEPVPGGIAAAVSAVALVVARGFYRSWLTNRRELGLSVRPVLLVGVNQEARDLVDLLSDHPELGFSACGVLGSRASAIQLGLDDLWRGHVSNAARVVQELGATGAIVTGSALSSAELNTVIRDLLAIGAHVHLSQGLRGIHHRRLLASPLAHEPLYYVERALLSRRQLATKRALDIVISVTALVVSAPVLLLAALAIKLQDRGPVLFRQERVGRDGKHFRILKLRTMVPAAEDLLVDLQGQNERSGPLFKLTSDPRVTPVGRVLRLTSIDELPQLINVLRGEMSLVGPRPALPAEVAAFDEELLSRSQVLPGITGLWQAEARDNPSFRTYRRLDLFYVENWSVTLDLAILVATFEAEIMRFCRRRRSAPAFGAPVALDAGPAMAD